MGRTIWLALIGSLVSILAGVAQVPLKFGYQGILTDENGVPLPDGTYTVTFRLYTQPTGGVAVWSETQQMEIEKGVFNAILGSVNSLENVSFGQPLWLGISVNGAAEFRPRVQLTAVPYSIMAKRVERDAIGTFEIADGSITLAKLSTEGAQKGQVIKFDGTQLKWDEDLGGTGSFALPFHDTVDFADQPAFWIEQTGTGGVARFEGLNENGSYVLDVRSEGSSPAIFVQHTNPLEIDANAIRAESEGGAATIYVEHHDGDGPAFKAWNFGSGGLAELYADSSTRNPSLAITSYSNYNSTVAKFRYAPVVPNVTPKTPVVDIQTLGYASNSLRILDSAGADHTIAVYKPKKAGNERAKSALYVEGATDRYFDAPIAHFVQDGSGYGLRVEQKNANAIAALAQFRNFGEGTGVQIITHNLRESLQTSELEAALYVENRSRSSSPVVFVYNKDTMATGVALSVLQQGRGSALQIIRTDSSVSAPTAVFQGWTELGMSPYTDDAVVTIESRYNGFNAGLALSVRGSTVMESRGLAGPALRLRANLPMLVALQVDTGSVVFGDDLQVDGAINADERISVGGVGLNGILLQPSNSYFPGDVQMYGDVYIDGNLSVSGMVTKGGGSFRIDHPLDPDNKYLYHFFVESPEMKNVYDGIAVCDAKGEAEVVLPDWFEALNEDFRYQLTCIGGYAPVYIKEEIRHNRFVIAGGKPGLKVSWQVTGVRKDKWALEHRISIEQEKRSSGDVPRRSSSEKYRVWELVPVGEEDIIVNVRTRSPEPRYVVFRIVLEVDGSIDESRLERLLPLIKDEIISVVSAHWVEEFLQPEFQQRLRAEIAARVQPYFGKVRIRKVRFVKFLIQ